MFGNLGTDNARKILLACEFRQAGSWEVLCTVREASNELFILLSGQLGIYTDANVQLATVQPVAPVGEMGLITGEPRSATVKALERSNLLVLKKPAFESLMRNHGDICLKVYCNVIQTLWGRLGQSRRQQREVSLDLDDHQSHLQRVEREISRLRDPVGRQL